MATTAIKATYSDIKTVKTRGVCQLVFEMPIEQMPDALALLGAPVPSAEVWVGIARLNLAAADSQQDRRASLAQLAGILSNEAAFIRYAHEHATGRETISGRSEAAAAEYIRCRCGVKSRAHLDTDGAAGQRFRDLRADYRLWLADIAA